MGRSPGFEISVVTARAMELFWRHGYEATSIDDLSSHLGIGRASFYNTFGDKRGALQAALDMYGEASCAALSNFAAREGRGREVIEAMLRWQRDDAFTSRHPRGCFFLTMATELREEDVGVIECVRAGLLQIESTFAQLLRRGRADGSLRGDFDPVKRARYLTGVMIGVRTLSRVSAPPEMVTALLDTALATLD